MKAINGSFNKIKTISSRNIGRRYKSLCHGHQMTIAMQLGLSDFTITSSTSMGERYLHTKSFWFKSDTVRVLNLARECGLMLEMNNKIDTLLQEDTKRK